MAPRTILYTGKGGVGKTSVAAATARRCAAQGLRTVVLSTDPAHSLSDSLGAELDADPTQVRDHLWGQEVQAQAELERNWGQVQTWLSRLLVERGILDIAAEELTVPPGMDELFSLLEIKRHHASGEFDVVIVDCAPTGETLRLLSFPEIAQWWLEKVFPVERRLVSAARPIARTLLDIDLPGEDVLAEVNSLVLGTGEVSVLDMATGFSTFANRGVHNAPTLVQKIEQVRDDGRVRVVEQFTPSGDRVLTEQEADLVTYCLRKVVLEGTGKAANIGKPVAGKTGTTQDNRDAWFVGYTPKLTAAVWMGYPGAPNTEVRFMDDVHGREVTGGSFPAEIWAKFMRAATKGKDMGSFKVPTTFPGRELHPELQETGSSTTGSSSSTSSTESTSTTGGPSSTSSPTTATTVPPTTSPPTTSPPTTAAPSGGPTPN